MSTAEDPDRITVGQRIVLPAPATVRTNASRSSWDPDDGGSSSKPKLRLRSFCSSIPQVKPKRDYLTEIDKIWVKG
jgi:hypothetical protein